MEILKLQKENELLKFKIIVKDMFDVESYKQQIEKNNIKFNIAEKLCELVVKQCDKKIYDLTIRDYYNICHECDYLAIMYWHHKKNNHEQIVEWMNKEFNKELKYYGIDVDEIIEEIIIE